MDGFGTTYLLQRFDGGLIFLSELQRRLHFGGVGHDLCVELAAFGHEPLLALVGLLEGAGDLLVLCTELVHALVPQQFPEDHLELLLQRLKGLLSILATFLL